ncbi:MAG TPA: hypothetical protein VLC08_15660 [Chitinolyticbacter sp.]|nr:hypothetical protein [Chitinolyticbacter sp.]
MEPAPKRIKLSEPLGGGNPWPQGHTRQRTRVDLGDMRRSSLGQSAPRSAPILSAMPDHSASATMQPDLSPMASTSSHATPPQANHATPSLQPTGPGFLAPVNTASSSAPVAPESQRRSSSRIQQQEQRKLSALMAQVPDPHATHFGLDATTMVRSAQASYMAKSGGSDPNEREEAYAAIDKNARKSANLNDLLPSAMVRHVEHHLASGGEIHQADKRVNPQQGGAYPGAMFTSGVAQHTPPDAKAKRETKTIPEPSSPKPDTQVEGPYHRTHAAPYDVVGDASNHYKTVWAPQGGNLIVDRQLERIAQASAKRQDSVSLMLRADSHDRSSVGFLSRQAPTGQYTLHAAQYQRRDNAPSGAASTSQPPAHASSSATGEGHGGS